MSLFLNQIISPVVSAMNALEAEERAMKFQLLKVHNENKSYITFLLFFVHIVSSMLPVMVFLTVPANYVYSFIHVYSCRDP